MIQDKIFSIFTAQYESDTPEVPEGEDAEKEDTEKTEPEIGSDDESDETSDI